MKFIEIKNCYKVYKNGVAAVADLSLKINKGEFVFVIGASGSGKSTLIKMLYREEKPTKGTVEIGGINVGKLRNRTVYKLRRLWLWFLKNLRSIILKVKWFYKFMMNWLLIL